MSRSKEKYRLGIRGQMMLIILALFLAGGGILGSSIHAKLWQSLEAQIIRELQGRQENTLIYIRQLLMLQGANNDEEGYKQIAEDIVRELRILGGQGFSVLDTRGQYLSGNRQIQEDPAGTDLAEAVRGNAAFTMTYPNADTMLVYLSMPVTIEERTIGIIRYRMDTSGLYVQIRQNERLIYQVTAIVYALIFLLLAFFLNRLLVPVGKLTEITRQIVRDLPKEQVDMQMLAQLADSGRQDEVGELSRNFSVMLETIGSQFRKMQADKERIISLLGSRQEFYNNMTHELKTPISSISLAAQMLGDEAVTKSPQMMSHLGRVVQDESKRLRFLVEKVLQMSMFDRQKAIFKPKELDLNEMVENAAQSFQLRVEHTGGKIYTEIEAIDSALLVDEIHFTNAIFNLMDNAVKYSKPDQPLYIYLRTWNDASHLYLSIRDTGLGMKKEVLRKIWDKFYRAHTGNRHDVKGFGLGLAYVKKIVELHNGKISVESVLGEGTTFVIQLPIIDE